MSVTFTVFFEDPFWVGLYIITDDDSSRCARVIFGKEPADAEVYDYLMMNYRFLEFTDCTTIEGDPRPSRNPKRQQREIGKALHDRSGIKKSYEAVKAIQQESAKKQRHAERKNIREEKATHKRIVRDRKRKEKRRH